MQQVSESRKLSKRQSVDTVSYSLKIMLDSHRSAFSKRLNQHHVMHHKISQEIILTCEYQSLTPPCDIWIVFTCNILYILLGFFNFEIFHFRLALFFYIWLTLFYKNVRWFNKHNNFNKFGNYIMIWALKGWVSVIIQFLLGLINYYDSDYPYQICLIFIFETSNLHFCGGDAGCVAYRFSTKKQQHMIVIIICLFQIVFQLLFWKASETWNYHQHHCHYHNHDILSGWETQNKRAQSHPVSAARGWSQRMERPKKENKYMREREKWSFVLER